MCLDYHKDQPCAAEEGETWLDIRATMSLHQILCRQMIGRFALGIFQYSQLLVFGPNAVGEQTYLPEIRNHARKQLNSEILHDRRSIYHFEPGGSAQRMGKIFVVNFHELKAVLKQN